MVLLLGNGNGQLHFLLTSGDYYSVAPDDPQQENNFRQLMFIAIWNFYTPEGKVAYVQGRLDANTDKKFGQYDPHRYARRTFIKDKEKWKESMLQTLGYAIHR